MASQRTGHYETILPPRYKVDMILFSRSRHHVLHCGLKPISAPLCSKRWTLTRHTFPCKPSQLSQLCMTVLLNCEVRTRLDVAASVHIWNWLWFLLNRNSLEFSSVCGHRKGVWLRVFNMWWPMTWMWNACCMSRVAGPSEQQRWSCPGPVSTRGTALLLTWARWVVLSVLLCYHYSWFIHLLHQACVCVRSPLWNAAKHTQGAVKQRCFWMLYILNNYCIFKCQFYFIFIFYYYGFILQNSDKNQNFFFSHVALILFRICGVALKKI